MKFVLDTNVLIDGYNDEFSVAFKLVEAASRGDLQVLATHPVQKEYRLILRRLIQDEEYRARIMDLLEHAQMCEPQHADIQIDDQEDAKFIEAALGGGADAIVTSDRHLLDVGEVSDIDIITPQEAWTRFEEDENPSGAWQDFMGGLLGSK